MEGPKIVYPLITKRARFAFDETGARTDYPTYFMSGEHPYLLGVLNSEAVWAFLKSMCSALGDPNNGGRLELRTIFMELLPIPTPSSADRVAIEDLVQRCLDARGQGPEVAEWEAEINQRVTRLYGLPDDG